MGQLLRQPLEIVAEGAAGLSAVQGVRLGPIFLNKFKENRFLNKVLFSPASKKANLREMAVLT